MTTTSLPTRPTAPAAAALRRQRRDWRGWAFVAPFMIVFVAMIIAPVVYALYLSLFREQLIGGNHFVGLANYLAGAPGPEVLGVASAGSRCSWSSRCRSCSRCR